MDNIRIIQGLMRCLSLSDDELYKLILFDLDNGINYFDLADCYGDGEVEEKFGRIMKEHKELRDKMFIQTKCSIVRGNDKYYDLSYEHIMESVELSLKRMNIDYVDSLLLHRIDILMDSKEIKRAFQDLKKKGLVKHFGVSNFSRSAIEYLDEELNGLIEINQVQLGLGQTRLIDEEINFNMNTELGESHTTGTLFYMKKKKIQIQAWSPFLNGFFDGSIFDKERFPILNDKLEELAKKYGTTKASIATKFLLMVDPNLLVVTGSMDEEHIYDSINANFFEMTKEDWYALYKSSGKMLP